MPVGIDRYAYATVSVAGTSNIASTSVILHTIVIGPSSGTMTVCDGTATTAATVALLVPGTTQGMSCRYDVECGQGLKVVTNADIKASISYTKI